MPYHIPLPPRWSEDRLERHRERALSIFVAGRGREGTRLYEELFWRHVQLVERLFDQTGDLLTFDGSIFSREPVLLAPARHLTVPPISNDDLNTLAGGRVSGRKRVGPELADRAAAAVQVAFDPVRFPWLRERRSPTSTEREAAIRWTAGIWTVEALRTWRRGESSRRQEAAVIRGLDRIGWKRQTLRTIETLEDIPRGSFSSEAALAGSKCDIPVWLRDGRLLALECKVSNSAINSVKRLNREVGGKADQWRRTFGEQVIPAAVLSGVFKLRNLVDAQERHKIALFWQHDLKTLLAFVRSI